MKINSARIAIILSLLVIVSGLFLPEKMYAQLSIPEIEGRWDMTVNMGGNLRPSWFEVVHSGNKRLIGHFVGTGGSSRPVSQVFYSNGKIKFSLPPQWEAEDHDIEVEGTLKDGMLSGTMVDANGKTYSWTAVRAPSLRPSYTPVWGNPIQLFNGKNLDGWKVTGTKNQWLVENGILRSPKAGSNLVTNEKFSDFKLHVEFRYAKGSNSGIYLRGRYELQVIDSYGKDPAKDLMGGVYGFISPTEMAAKPAGEWQTYDITLTGRFISVVLNGKQVICNAEIPGITGGALDSREGEIGPIYLQGDHDGDIEFRSIVITPAKKG